MTSEEYLDKILYLEKDKGEKIIEKSPLKMMGKDALMFSYSDIDSEGKETIYRSYFIDDGEKGRCYKYLSPSNMKAGKDSKLLPLKHSVRLSP
jgi:hypothetical protein